MERIIIEKADHGYIVRHLQKFGSTRAYESFEKVIDYLKSLGWR